MERRYKGRARADKSAARELLAQEGRHLLPLVDVFVGAGHALDGIVDEIGRAAIEAVLESTEVAGPRQPGRRRESGAVACHGRQKGLVHLADRAVRVDRPRLRRPGEGEVEIPAYEALRRPDGLGDRMLELLMRGVSTRAYGEAIGGMAEAAGVSRSSVSRRAIEAAGERLKELSERRLDDADTLAVYLDGIQFGGHHVLVALGVDADGGKRALGIREGASENSAVTLALLEDSFGRGLDPTRPRLFVIDGSKALRGAIRQVFGDACRVQRCRNHKMRSVLGHLPKELRDQARAVLRAAWKLEAREGRARIEQFASWVERDHPSAAASLREGLAELFIVSELWLAGPLLRQLSTGDPARVDRCAQRARPLDRAENVVFLGPPGSGKRTWRSASWWQRRERAENLLRNTLRSDQFLGETLVAGRVTPCLARRRTVHTPIESAVGGCFIHSPR